MDFKEIKALVVFTARLKRTVLLLYPIYVGGAFAIGVFITQDRFEINDTGKLLVICALMLCIGVMGTIIFSYARLRIKRAAFVRSLLQRHGRIDPLELFGTDTMGNSALLDSTLSWFNVNDALLGVSDSLNVTVVRLLPKAVPHTLILSNKRYARQDYLTFKRADSRGVQAQFDQRYSTYTQDDNFVNNLMLLTPDNLWRLFAEKSLVDVELLSNMLVVRLVQSHTVNGEDFEEALSIAESLHDEFSSEAIQSNFLDNEVMEKRLAVNVDEVITKVDRAYRIAFSSGSAIFSQPLAILLIGLLFALFILPFFAGATLGELL